MRTPDRGSTTGAASWTDRERSKRAAPQGRAKRVNPPLTAIFKIRARTKVRAFFFYILRWGMRTPDRGSTTGAASWTDRARSKRAAPQGRAKRVNPPLTAIFKIRARTKVRAFFFYILRWGMRTPDRGSTTGAASWTDRARSKRAAPQGRAKRVNPPLTAIFEMRARTKVRALFASGPCKLSRGRHKCLARATHPTGRTINK